MRLHLSLSTKVICFVAVPLVLQLALLASLASLQSQAEEALKESTHSRKISDTINRISQDVFETVSVYGNEKSLELVPLDDISSQNILKRIHQDYDELKSLVGNDPEIMKAITTSEDATNRSLLILRDLKTSFLQTGSHGRDARKPVWHKLRDTMKEILFQDLLAIGDQQKRLSDKAPEVQAMYRKKAQTVMLGIGLFDLALGLALALFLTRGITNRLQRLNENTYRLASNKPLHAVLKGSDEIARLDQVFHQMARELNESSRKERAIIENARDFICTIDNQGRFIAANPASKAMLGYEADELRGKHFIDLISGADSNKALEYLENLKTSGVATPLEVTMASRTGGTVETLWSAHWSEEEKSTFCVIHDMTDRKRAEKLRQEVTAMITHDLRTPLSTINNVLDFFESGHSGTFDEKGRRYVLMAKRNADRMVSLINDLLDIEKIKSGMMRLEIDVVSLTRVFKTCAELSAAMAEEMSVKLLFEPTDIMVEADEHRIDRVLTNLVANAIRFSPKGATVRVAAKRTRTAIHIVVQDEGPGIPADMLESVFERFQQVKNSGEHSKGGSGLGLTICKAIVELHGGKIWAESQGRGTTFIFSLPNEN